MNKIHHRRLYLVSLFLMGLALAAGLILYALKQNINVFLTPSQITAAKVTPDLALRLGGMVKKGSVVREKEGLGVSFIVTDLKKDVRVHFNGVLPDLFREGTGVIAEGHLNAQGLFMANLILAKHDEKYMPKNVYQAMRKQAA